MERKNNVLYFFIENMLNSNGLDLKSSPEPSTSQKWYERAEDRIYSCVPPDCMVDIPAGKYLTEHNNLSYHHLAKDA